MHTFPSPVDFARAIRNGSAKNLIPDAFRPETFHRQPELLRACIDRIHTWLNKPIEVLSYSDFRRFQEDGNRLQFEDKFFSRRARLSDLALGIMAGEDPDGSWMRALEDILWEICNEPNWALPAHLWPAREESEAAGMSPAAFYPPNPYRHSYRTVIDLFAAQQAFSLAEILHVIGDRLNPEITARCHAEIRERVLDAFLEPANLEHWILMRNNWAAVCGGSVFATFLYEEPNPDRCLNALWPVLAAMHSFFESFPADGTCLEGSGYWAYGFGYFVQFADVVREYTAGAINLMDNDAVRAIASFPTRVALSPNRSVSYSDCDSAWSPPRWLLHRLHTYYPELPLPPCSSNPSSWFISYLLREFLWTLPNAPEAPLPNAIEYLPDAQWLVVRHNDFAFSAAFGSNDVPHNQNDIGTFLMIRGNAEGPMDLGSGEYTHEYFNAGRYDFLVCSSRGHSVPIVAGTLQHAGSDAAARDVQYATLPDGSTSFSADIAAAYALDTLRALRRTFTIAPKRASVTVSDAFDFTSTPQVPTVERFIGYVKPVILEPGRVQFGAFTALFDPTLPTAIQEHTFSNHGGVPTHAYSLDITLPLTSNTFQIRFE